MVASCQNLQCILTLSYFAFIKVDALLPLGLMPAVVPEFKVKWR